MKNHRLLAAVALAAIFAPVCAEAGGGVFRSSTPIDQAAERVIFHPLGDGRIEQYLEIKYTGEPADFAWVLPVMGAPTREDLSTDFPAGAFNMLDVLTQPTFDPPPDCYLPEEAMDGGVAPVFGGDAGVQDGNGDLRELVDVWVFDRGTIGDYEFVSLGATTGDALTAWLRENGFRIHDNMVPFIDLYVGEGQNFLAIKLQPGMGADSIAPLKVVLDSKTPTLPLRLTSLAAVPEMGVKVFILGDIRYTPTSVPNLAVAEENIVFNIAQGRSNWSALVARAIDAAQGQGIVTDFAGLSLGLLNNLDTTDAPVFEGEDIATVRQAVRPLLESARYVTRMYGRYSPEEMGTDLVFAPDEVARGVAKNHLLTRSQVMDCAMDPPPPDPCAFAACGQGGECFVVGARGSDEPTAACACTDGAVARTVREDAPMIAEATDVGPFPSVSCIDIRMNIDPLTPIIVGPQPLPNLPDPCETDPCGSHGECFALNGQQTCKCEHGYVAVATMQRNGTFASECQEPAEKVPDDFYRRTLPEPTLPFPSQVKMNRLANEGCAVVPGEPPGTRPWPLLLGLPVLFVFFRRARRTSPAA